MDPSDTIRTNARGLAASKSLKRATEATQPIALAPQHTPGPWTVGIPDASDPRPIHRQIGGQFGEIATTTADERDDGRRCWDRAEANARLIAAAPDMLEALRAAVRCGVIGAKYADPTEGARAITDDADMAAIRAADPSLVVDFRAAIAKATGVKS